MEFEIKERREYKDEASGKIYTNYKFFYGGKTYWIGQKAFEKNAKLLKIEDNKIVLKEPLKEFYELKIRKNKKGEFKTILPKTEIEAEKSIAKEPEVSYETKAIDLKKPFKKTRNQEIEGFFKLPLPKTIDKKESISKTETSLKEPKQPKKTKEQSRQAFISGLIPHIKTADEKVKDRYFDLLSKEMERMPQMEDRIMWELGEVKEKMSYIGDYNKDDDAHKTIIDLTKHKPIHVVRFLDLFRESEGIKYLTHDFNTTGKTFKREEILTIAKKEFEKAKKEFWLSTSLHSRFLAFAFGDIKKGKYWYFNGKKYELNWKSKEIIEWCENNPQMHPLNNPKFEEEMIKPFQDSYKITKPNLEILLKNKLAESLGELYSNFSIEFQDCNEANLVTDVDSFLAGIERLFIAIKQRKENGNKIKIIFTRKGLLRFLKIIHVNSNCDKPLDKNEIMNKGVGGDLTEAEKRFYRVCDWSIIANNPDESVNKINILYDINKDIKSKEFVDEKIEGFTHLLTFYS